MGNGRIIVNADDFGFSKSISDTIIDYIGIGYCNSTTVMINSSDYSETFCLAKDAGIVDKVGLHLNLTVGVPISDMIKECPSFCKGGVFSGYKSNLIKRFVLTKEERLAVEIEVRSQIERYLNTGYKGMSLDSHQGVHFDLSIYPIVLRLFNEYGFKRIRRAPNINIDRKRSIVRFPYECAIKNAGISTTDYLTNFKGIREAAFDLNCNQSIEIMCHPQRKQNEEYIDGVAGLLLKDYLDIIDNYWNEGGNFNEC